MLLVCALYTYNIYFVNVLRTISYLCRIVVFQKWPRWIVYTKRDVHMRYRSDNVIRKCSPWWAWLFWDICQNLQRKKQTRSVLFCSFLKIHDDDTEPNKLATSVTMAIDHDHAYNIFYFMIYKVYNIICRRTFE